MSLHKNYYLLHGTKNEDNIINILKTGFMKPAKMLENKYKNFSGTEDYNQMPNIFFNIYFVDLQNIKATSFNYLFILHPSILKDFSFTFDKGWGYQKFLEINKDDNDDKFDEKIEKIHKYLSNPDLPQVLRNACDFMHHQLYTETDTEIPIKYIIGIIFNYIHDNDKFNEIKQLIKEKNLKIKLYFNIAPPKLTGLFKIKIK